MLKCTIKAFILLMVLDTRITYTSKNHGSAWKIITFKLKLGFGCYETVSILEKKMFCFTQVSWSHQNSIYCTGKYVYATKVFPHSAVYVLILTNLYFGIIKYDKRRYFMCTLDSFLQGKWHDHVWDFPAPIIPWEESRVWLWHVCFPTSLRPVCSPPQTLCPEQQGLRTDVTFTHWEVCFLEVWKTGDRDYWRTRSLMAVRWLLNLKAFFKHYSTDYCTVAFTGFRDDQKKYTWTHCRLFTDCLEYAV